MFSNSKIKVSTLALLVSFITVLVYLPVLQNDFVNWDDNLFVYENTHIQSIDIEFFKWMFTTFLSELWAPLTWLSHATDYAIWGLTPSGHHLTSIMFHGLNTFLVVILVARLVYYVTGRNLEPPDNRINRHPYHTALITGITTGFLFGLHPLHVESVAWVSERKDVLYSFFFLLSILSYVNYTSFEKQNQKILYYSLSLICFIFSLMSKAMAVTLPAVLIILDFYPLKRLDFKSLFISHRKVLIEKIPFFALSLALLVVTVIANKAEEGIVSPELLTLDYRILVAFRAIGFYLFKMIWPTDLVPLYPYPSEISVFMIEYAASIILFFAVTAFCVYSWRKQKVWSAVWIYFLVTLLPVLGIIQIGIKEAAADRYTYLTSLGPYLLIGLGAARLFEKNKRTNIGSITKRLSCIILLIIISASLSYLTINQIRIWKNSITLWNKMIQVYPDSSHIAYYNRGKAFEASGNYIQAIENHQN
jgi:hypothetical protein